MRVTGLTVPWSWCRKGCAVGRTRFGTSHPGRPPRPTVVSRVTRQTTPFPGATAGRGVGRVSVGDTTPSRIRSPKQGKGAGQGHPQPLGLPAAWRPVSRDSVSPHDPTCRSDRHRHSERRRGNTAQLPRPAGQGHPQAGGAGSPQGGPAGQGRPQAGGAGSPLGRPGGGQGCGRPAGRTGSPLGRWAADRVARS